MDLQFFQNKLMQVREHLGPFRERLEIAAQTAPTEELKKVARDLLQNLSKSYDDSVTEIHQLVNLYTAENEKVQQAARELEAATGAAQQRQQAAAAVAAPKESPKFAFDPAVLERLKQQLIEHVGIIEQRPKMSQVLAGGHHFADWVNESLTSSVSADAQRNDPSAANANSSIENAPNPARTRFDSWLSESIASVAGTTAPKQESPVDSAHDQREWEKLLGG